MHLMLLFIYQQLYYSERVHKTLMLFLRNKLLIIQVSKNLHFELYFNNGFCSLKYNNVYEITFLKHLHGNIWIK